MGDCRVSHFEPSFTFAHANQQYSLDHPQALEVVKAGKVARVEARAEARAEARVVAVAVAVVTALEAKGAPLEAKGAPPEAKEVPPETCLRAVAAVRVMARAQAKAALPALPVRPAPCLPAVRAAVEAWARATWEALPVAVSVPTSAYPLQQATVREERGNKSLCITWIG
jgi:hypothetical protein